MSRLYNAIKSTILDTPRCPDGSSQLACPSCLAEAIDRQVSELLNSLEGTA